MAVTVVTTTNRKGWAETGRRMAESFVARWPRSVLPLIVYAEDFDPDIRFGIEVRRLPDWLNEFKARFGGFRGNIGRRSGVYDYRYDAVKFAHKVAALTDAGLQLKDGILIWLDADTFTHADVTEEWLEGLFPPPSYLAWLDRKHSHPECGFVMYRCSHSYHRAFMDAFRRLYVSGDLFTFRETHDSFVLQCLVKAKVAAGKIEPPVSLSGAGFKTGHVLANSPLSTRLDHMKGNRKFIGRTPKEQRRLNDGNPYWT